jgi:hypothetical protein
MPETQVFAVDRPIGGAVGRCARLDYCAPKLGSCRLVRSSLLFLLFFVTSLPPHRFTRTEQSCRRILQKRNPSTEKETTMKLRPIMTTLVILSFVIPATVVSAANSGNGDMLKYQKQYESQNRIQNRYQKNDSSLNGDGVKTQTRTKTTTTTRTKNRSSR